MVNASNLSVYSNLLIFSEACNGSLLAALDPFKQFIAIEQVSSRSGRAMSGHIPILIQPGFGLPKKLSRFRQCHR
jgi:hypothetical protein